MDPNRNIRKKLKIFRRLIFCALFLFSIIGLTLFIGRMEETVTADGVVEGLDDYELRTMIDCKITKINKDEGELVKKGDTIVEFDARELLDKIELLKNQVCETEAELAVKMKALEILKDDPLPTHYRHSEIALEERRKKFQKSKEKLEMYRDLKKKKVVSKIAMDKVEEEYYTDAANLKKAIEDSKRVHNGMGEKRLKKAESEKKLLEIKLANNKRYLKRLEEHLADYRIIAPDNGIITYMPHKRGRYLEEGDLVGRLSSVKKKKLVAYVDERQIFKVKRGQSARIISRTYNHFNFGYFHGEVLQIAELPVRKQNSFCYPVEVLLTREPYDLKLGSTAEIMIITGKERIISAVLGLNDKRL
jgi:multidrug resistance efflux pump